MSDKVNPEMLVLAREAAGLSQSALASAVSISQGNISRYESGSLEVSREHLAKIAQVLGRPDEFFFQTDRVYGFGSPCLFHRKRSTLPISELRKIHATVNIIRMQVDRLLRGVQIDSPNRFHRMDVQQYGGDAERVARLVRSAWGLPLGPVKDLIGSIEDAGGIVLRFPFGTAKIDAVSQWPPDLGGPPLFFVNTEIPGDRLRFTLAHEVGHVIMHAFPTADMEREADKFAAEFLMPAKQIAPDLAGLTLPRLAQLKSYWKTAMSAILRRGRDLGKVSEWQYKNLSIQMSALGYQKKEPVPILQESPAVVEEIVGIYTGEHEYAASDLARLVVALEQEVRSRYLPEESPPPGFGIVG